MKQSTCSAVFCQPGGDELKHDIDNAQPGFLSLSPADLRTQKHQSCVVILLKQW